MSFPPPGEVPVVFVYAGDDTIVGTYTFTDSGTPEDLSPYTFTAQWRPRLDSDSPLSLEVDDTLAATGTITVSADAAVTRAMGGNGYFDLQGELGGEVRTFVFGRTKYREDVTRA